jgi:hypothetical protein
MAYVLEILEDLYDDISTQLYDRAILLLVGLFEYVIYLKSRHG